METTERGQWKLVFNKDASRVMTMSGGRPSEMLANDIRYFVSAGLGWENTKTVSSVACTSAQRNEKGVLKACLLFNEAGLTEIQTRADKLGLSVPDFIADKVPDGIGNLRYWGEGCTVRVTPIGGLDHA